MTCKLFFFQIEQKNPSRTQAVRKLFFYFVEVFYFKHVSQKNKYRKLSEGPNIEMSQLNKILPTFTWQKRCTCKGCFTFLQPRTSTSVWCFNIQNYLLLQTDPLDFFSRVSLFCINERSSLKQGPESHLT